MPLEPVRQDERMRAGIASSWNEMRRARPVERESDGLGQEQTSSWKEHRVPEETEREGKNPASRRKALKDRERKKGGTGIRGQRACIGVV